MSAADFTIEEVSDEQRGDPLKNEDQTIVKENKDYIVAAVFDGATAIADVKYFKELGKSPGRLVAEIARESTESLAFEIDPVETIFKINQAIHEGARKIPVDEKTKAELFTTMGLIIRIDKKERLLSFAAVGDCALITLDTEGKFKWYLDEQAAKFDRKEIETAIVVSHQEGVPMRNMLENQEVTAVIAKHRKLENAPLGAGYGALKGSADNDVQNYLRNGESILKPGEKVFLISDGMFISPLNTPQEKEIIEESLKEGGLKLLLKRIREIQKDDVDFKKYPRLKQYDDASGIEIELIH